jgi:dolichol-phosphate mannosyltransferase
MDSLRHLSVVLPVINERDNLAELIPELCNALSPLVENFEIIVVDDSSTDGTDLLVADLAIKESRLRYFSRIGKPASLPMSLSDGIYAASFDHVAWMDADGSMPPTTLVDLVNAYRFSLEAEPIVVGSRFVFGGGFKGIETVGETSVLQLVRNLRNSNDSLTAVLLSRVLNRYLWVLLGRCCHDLASGFVVASRQSAIQIGLRGSYGDYCVRFIYFAHRQGHRIIEVPYVCQLRRYGYSKTGTTLWELIKRGLPYIALPLTIRRTKEL